MCPFCKVPLTKRHGIYIFPLCGMQFIDEEDVWWKSNTKKYISISTVKLASTKM